MKHRRTLRAACAVAALAAAGVVVTAGTAASADVAKGLDATIKIKGNGHPRFDAPDTVLAGQDLQIVNKTNPQAIGPHTFSLVEKSEVPKGRDELKRCFKFKDVCKHIVESHGVFPRENDFEVDDYDVENGLAGWDARYEGSTYGDSWVTETQDETTSRQVTATPGNMWFICAVHPFMKGKVEVQVVR